MKEKSSGKNIMHEGCIITTGLISTKDDNKNGILWATLHKLHLTIWMKWVISGKLGS